MLKLFHTYFKKIILNAREENLRPANLLKTDSNTDVFPVKVTKFLITHIFTEHLR